MYFECKNEDTIIFKYCDSVPENWVIGCSSTRNQANFIIRGVLVRRERENVLTGNVVANKCGRIKVQVMILSFRAFLPACDLKIA